MRATQVLHLRLRLDHRRAVPVSHLAQRRFTARPLQVSPQQDQPPLGRLLYFEALAHILQAALVLLGGEHGIERRGCLHTLDGRQSYFALRLTMGRMHVGGARGALKVLGARRLHPCWGNLQGNLPGPGPGVARLVPVRAGRAVVELAD